MNHPSHHDRTPRFLRMMYALWLLAIVAIPGVLLSQPAAPADTGSITIRSLGPIINTAGVEYAPTVTADGLKLYFVSSRPGGYGGHDFWYVTKQSRLDTVF